MGLLGLLRRRPHQASDPAHTLLPATDAVQRYRQDGGDARAACRGALAQLAGLRRELDDDTRWARIVRMARQAGDPWNADDWPLGFDALVCAAPLCADVSFECARCPVGQRQGGSSCAHPTSAFGSIGVRVREGNRDAVREQVAAIEAMLNDALSADPP